MKIRELRKAKKITMKEFGKIIGVAESTMSLYETGKRKPDPETLSKMADYLGVSVDCLMGREEAQPQPAPSPADQIKQGVAAEMMRMSIPEMEKVYDYARFVNQGKK